MHRQIVPDSRSSCTEGSVAKVGARPNDEKHTSVSRVQSSWAGVDDEAAVVSQVAGSMFGERLVDEGDDVELDARLHWKPVQLAVNWRAVVALPVIRC